MAIDTPARIAIIGAGPIGIEAALYARFLGYQVDLFERGSIAENIASWGHVRLFSPWAMNTTSLGRAAIEAQDADWVCPPASDYPTGHEYIEQYLKPLAQTDLVADQIHEQTEVVSVGRDDLLKRERVGDEHRADTLFRILVRSSEDGEKIYNADVVIDASGTFGNHNWLGVGGVPAVGEIGGQEFIEYGLPDLLGADRERYAGLHTLVVGRGYSAATNVVALAELAREAPDTRVTWITRGEDRNEPMSLIDNDRLSARDALARDANALANDPDSVVEYCTATSVDSLARVEESGRINVTLAGKHAESIEVDQVLANVGYRPDQSIYSELQVHSCYATDGPMKLAASLAGDSSGDCLDQASTGPESLLNPEPNFHILGAKSYGRDLRFLISVGLEQIRDLFTIIGDRADLDLYRESEPKFEG